MADSFEFKITGLDGVVEKLRTFGPKLQKKGLRAAVTKGAAVVRKAARENSKRLDDPETAAVIHKAIASQYQAKASNQIGGVVVKVGVRGGAKPRKGDKDTGHWRLLEFGTEKMRAQPFMRPALEQNIQPATDAVVAELNKQIDKLAGA